MMIQNCECEKNFFYEQKSVRLILKLIKTLFNQCRIEFF